MSVSETHSRVLYLFPDTNLFIQCLPLADLPWSDLGDFDEIHLMVSRPVQREIDNQKRRGNDRVGQRARIAYGLFRRIIASDLDYEVVTTGKPIVKLILDAATLPSPELKDRLDYNKPDDEIVGCLHRFQQDNLDKRVQLLTHDGGPMMTANHLDLYFVPIPDDWLLQPENNDGERELARLRHRVAELENAEPRVELICVDDQGKKTISLEVEYATYPQLADEDVAALLESLKARVPTAEDFGSSESDQRQAPGILASTLRAMETYTPASDEAIARYIEQDHPRWVSECEKFFVSLHETLHQDNRKLVLSFVADNCGARPVKDALVRIESRGDLKVCVPADDAEHTDEGEITTALHLPHPPRPPRGRWRSTSSLSMLAGGLPSMAGALSSALRLSPMVTRPEFALPVGPLDSRRDPNAFYYKPRRPRDPVASFDLECEQWRHGIGDEYFDVEVFFDLSAEKIEGAVECSIHAENTSRPISLLIPVRITVKRANTRHYADQLIRDL